MRTNVEIDDELMRRALEASGQSTKKAAVTEALRLVVQLKSQEAIGDLFGAVRWEGNLDEMRATRFPDWDGEERQERNNISEPAA